MKLVFASANLHKVREASEILGGDFEVLSAAEAGVTEDIPETGDSFRANSLQKAKFIHERTGMDCFADDSGLEVEILGGQPGIYTARYGGPARRAEDNIAKLLREMSRREFEASIMREFEIRTPHATRRARFRTSVTLILNGETIFFDGTMEGRIARIPSGTGGFGYDPVFIADAYPDVTVAQLPEDTKNAISHRGNALRAMAKYLKERNL